MTPEIVILRDQDALALDGALRVAAALRAAAGPFRLALAGGTTPRGMYRQLAALQLPWERLHVYWGDERCVPPDHPDSNFRLAEEEWLSRIPVPPANVHRIRGELPPAEAAAAYIQELAGLPPLDLIIQGMGAEGHTASVFPGSPALSSTEPVAAVFVPQLGAWRVTLTPVALSLAGAALFVVAGREKADAVRRVLTGPVDPQQLPAQSIRCRRVTWLLDREAAAGLEGPV